MTSTDVEPTISMPQPGSAPPSDSPLPLETPRRGALRWLTGGGIALVGAVSGIFATAAPASAAPYCCDLANPNGPYCNYIGCWFTCPSGTAPQVWTCASGTRILVCGECTSGSNCDIGPWPCSIWWDDSTC